MEQQEVNPTTIWARYMDYLNNTAKKMQSIYLQRTQEGGQITEAEIDDINKRVHRNLDIIVSNNPNVTDDTAPKTESRLRKNKVRLSESTLHRIIKESVQRIIKENV